MSLNFHTILEQCLTEAPISDFNLIGDWGPGAKARGYDKASRGILTSEKGVQRIKTLWQKVPEDFDIYMVSTKEGWKYTEVGEVNEEFIREKLKIDVPINYDHITIFYTNNKGSEKVPTTAWTLAHRFGHAIRRTRGYETPYEYKAIEREVDNLVKSVGSKIYRKDIDTQGRYNNNDSKEKREIANALGSFKSARDRKLRNYFEFTNELVAQYIVTGKIQFRKEFPKVLPVSFAWGRPNGPWGHLKDEDKEDLEHQIQNAENDIYDACEQLVASAVGRIYVM